MGSSHSSVRGGGSTFTLGDVVDRVKQFATNENFWGSLTPAELQLFSTVLHVPSSLPVQDAIRACKAQLGKVLSNKFDRSLSIFEMAKRSDKVLTILAMLAPGGSSKPFAHLKGGEAEDCVICSDPITEGTAATQLSCEPVNHNFLYHATCLQQWIDMTPGRRIRCPMKCTQRVVPPPARPANVEAANDFGPRVAHLRRPETTAPVRDWVEWHNVLDSRINGLERQGFSSPRDRLFHTWMQTERRVADATIRERLQIREMSQGEQQVAQVYTVSSGIVLVMVLLAYLTGMM